MYFCPYIIEIVDSKLFVKISDYTAYRSSPTLKTLILMTLTGSFFAPPFFFWLSKCFHISPIQRTNCSQFKRQTSEKRIYCHFWWFFFTLDPSLSCLWLTLQKVPLIFPMPLTSVLVTLLQNFEKLYTTHCYLTLTLLTPCSLPSTPQWLFLWRSSLV